MQQVGGVLGRAHLLFGDPPASGGVAALDAGSGLAAAGDLVRGGQARMTGLSGVLPAKYGGFATDAGAALDGAAGTDSSLGGQLDDAAGADRSGRASSGAVVNGAAADTAGLAPVSGTAPGQRALIAALRARVAQQQQVVNAHKALDARLAATVPGAGLRSAPRRWWHADGRNALRGRGIRRRGRIASVGFVGPVGVVGHGW